MYYGLNMTKDSGGQLLNAELLNSIKEKMGIDGVTDQWGWYAHERLGNGEEFDDWTQSGPWRGMHDGKTADAIIKRLIDDLLPEVETFIEEREKS